MQRTMTRRVRNLVCPSCGASIHFRHDRNRIGTCPQCGEWLIQRSRFTRKLDLTDDEPHGHAFDETDEWERELIDEIG